MKKKELKKEIARLNTQLLAQSDVIKNMECAPNPIPYLNEVIESQKDIYEQICSALFIPKGMTFGEVIDEVRKKQCTIEGLQAENKRIESLLSPVVCPNEAKPQTHYCHCIEKEKPFVRDAEKCFCLNCGLEKMK